MSSPAIAIQGPPAHATLLQRIGEYVLPLAAISVIFVMMVPLPASVLDFLLALSMAASIIVFLAAVQILVYVGAVSVLIILAIMLTREFSHGSPSNRLRLPAFVIAVLFFAVVSFAILKTNWNAISGSTFVSTESPFAPTTSILAGEIFSPTGFVLPLEIAAVIILAVIIGAVVIAREKDK